MSYWDYHEDPEITLAKATANAALIKAGRPPRYDLSGPSDQRIGNYMADTDSIGGKMRFWSTLTNGSLAGAFERMQARRAERQAEMDRVQVEVDQALRTMRRWQ